MSRSGKSVMVFVIATVAIDVCVQIIFQPKSDNVAILFGSAVIAYVLLVAIANHYSAKPTQHTDPDAAHKRSHPNSSSHPPGDDASGTGNQAPTPFEDACEELDLSAKPSIEEIKHAYREKVTQWHPDKLEGMAPELREIATEKLKRINRAYEVLMGATAAV